MLPGTQGVDAFGALPMPPPMTAGEVGTDPRAPGGVTLGLLVPGVALAPIDELPIADPGVVLNVPVIGAAPTPVVAPGVPSVLLPIDELPVADPGVVPNMLGLLTLGLLTLGLPMLGLATPGAEPTIGAGLNAPVIGAGAVPGAALIVPGVPVGAAGVAPMVAPAPAFGAAVCARHAGAAVIKAAAAADAMDFRLSMRVSFEW